MSFPRYPEYKDSGIDLLGEIPAYWKLMRVKYLLRDGYEGLKIGPFGSQLTSEMLIDNGPYRVYGQENVIADDFERGSRRIDESKFSELSVYEIRPGDVLVTMMGTSGRCAVVPEFIEPGVMDSHLLRMRLGEDMCPEFIRTLVDESDYVKNQVRLMGKGSIMHGLNSGVVKELFVALPSADEQWSILEFLLQEKAKIDSLIKDQEKLIALLKEKRQAVISHAVTKGLDPNVPMKDSGIEWLGEVPVHWDVARIKWVARMESGHTPDKKIAAYWENCEIPWVSLNDTGFLKENDYISDTAVRVNELGIANSSARILPARSVVFSRDATIGRCAITARPMAVSQHFIAWICDEDLIVPEFLLRVFRSMTQVLDRLTFGATVKTIGMPDIRTLITAVPPIDEQQKIVSYLSDALTKHDALICAAESAVTLLKERRSALISAAVTGKIDVRQYKAKEVA